MPKEFVDPKKQEEAGGEDEDGKPKLYVPSGPDGKGWGEMRQLNAADLKLLEAAHGERIHKEEEGEKTPKEEEEKEVFDNDVKVYIEYL